MGTYAFSGAPVFLTVGAEGFYDIAAYGAQGGASQSGTAGGLGARYGGSVFLTAGERLEIVVGQAGFASPYAGNGGGGGKSVVLGNTGSGYQPLVIAAGGGGAAGTDGRRGQHGRRPGHRAGREGARERDFVEW